MNLPNCITVFRMVLIGVYYYFFQAGNYLVALITYVVAALSDLLDGYLARKWNQITAFGKLFDPLADKLLLIVALLCFTMKGFLPWFILIFVLAKEGIMIIAGAVLYKKNVVVYAKKFGKYATLVFNVAVILTFALPFMDAKSQFYKTMHGIVIGLFVVAIALALCAFVQYAHSFWKNRNQLSEEATLQGKQD